MVVNASTQPSTQHNAFLFLHSLHRCSLNLSVYVQDLLFLFTFDLLIRLFFPSRRSRSVLAVRGQENGLDGTKAGGIAGRGTERGRRSRGRGRGGSFRC